MSAHNIDCGYSLESPRRGCSYEYPKSMCLSRNEKNNVYPCKPLCIKGVKIIYVCFHTPRSVRVAEWLVLLTLDYEVLGSNPARG